MLLSDFNKLLLVGIVTFTPTFSSYALPILDEGKFFGSASMFSSSDWSYSGTLLSSFNAGFKAKNIDDPVCNIFGCFGGDQQYATGKRTMSTTVGSNPAYTLALRGEFEAKTFEAWEDSLLDQSLGKKFDSDIDKIQFPSPGGSTTNEHPIPEAWRSLDGYANPAGKFAMFDQTFTLSEDSLSPGQGDCPLVVPISGRKTGRCEFTEAYFKAGTNLQANLQGSGSIENIVVGTQSVSIGAKADRVTSFKVNGDAIYSGLNSSDKCIPH